MARQPQTLGQVLRAATSFLSERNVYQAKLACELLAGRLLGCKPLELYVRFDTDLTDSQLEAMRRGTRRLAAGEPVQYIVGEVEFMGRLFKVDPRALIPRPETEVLVREVLDSVVMREDETPAVADIGTGSGCIIVTVAVENPGAVCLAHDVSVPALELAAENASTHGVLDRTTFVGGDLADVVEPDSLDVLVANLPYVPTAEWERLPVHIRDHEPRNALDGGPDGLSIIRDLVPDAWILLRDGGSLFLEIGAGQGESVRSILGESGFADARLVKDLAGHDRVAVASKAEDIPASA